MKIIQAGSKPKKVRTLIKRAKMGNPKAMFELGLLYDAGAFGEEDQIAAEEWIGEAADVGYKPAKEWLDENC